MVLELPSNWWVKYLGKPWQAEPNPPDSYNCGELVRTIHIDMVGIDSPVIPIENANSRRQCLDAMRPNYFGLFPLQENEEPRSLDVAFLGRKNRMAHCGIVIETIEGVKILHCPQSASGVVLDDFLQLRIMGFPEIKWFRHKDMTERLVERGWLCQKLNISCQTAR